MVQKQAKEVSDKWRLKFSRPPQPEERAASSQGTARAKPYSSVQWAKPVIIDEPEVELSGCWGMKVDFLG